MRKLLGPFLAAASAAMALLALSAGPAYANHAQCGDVITQDTTLDSDLLGCSGAALSVEGQGRDITLNLNGHTVEGALTSSLWAIRVDGNDLPGDLTVENGVVYGGIVVGHGTGFVEDILLRGGSGPARNGVDFFKGSRGEVSNTVIEGCSVGFDTAHAGTIDISHTVIRGNRTGLHAGQGGTPRLTDSAITDNTGVGVRLTLAGISLKRTLIARNGGYGVSAGIGGVTADHSRIIGNRAGGISMERGGLALADNTISQNGGDGVLALGSVSGSLIENTIDRNSGDGIRAETPNLTVTGNHAWFNGDLGIEAVPSTSGSGNWAKHNGNPAQCVPDYLCSTKGKPKE